MCCRLRCLLGGCSLVVGLVLDCFVVIFVFLCQVLLVGWVCGLWVWIGLFVPVLCGVSCLLAA